MRHHYPKNLSPRSRDPSSIVHGSRVSSLTTGNNFITYCGRHVMAATDHKALVTCKNCLRLMNEVDHQQELVRLAEIKRQDALGLTPEEQGIL